MTDLLEPRASQESASGIPPARAIHWNPSPAELREMTAHMPNARHTEFDNYNVQTRVVSRSKVTYDRGGLSLHAGCTRRSAWIT